MPCRPGVFIDGSRVFVAGGLSQNWGWLNAFSTTTTHDPVLGRYPADDLTVAVDVAGDYAYIQEIEGIFRVLDISSPDGIIERGSTDCGFGGAWTMDLQGSYAYVGVIYQGVLVIDVANPEEPRVVATLASLIYPWRLAAQGSGPLEAAALRPESTGSGSTRPASRPRGGWSRPPVARGERERREGRTPNQPRDHSPSFRRSCARTAAHSESRMLK
jgi:hypothetical protein